MNQPNAQHIDNIEMDLRLLDPLSVVDEGFDDRQHVEWLQDDIGDVDYVLKSDTTLTTAERQELLTLGTDLRLDWLYAESGGQALGYEELSERIDGADEFIKKSLRHAQANAAVDPVPYWDACSKTLDLQSLRAFSNAREAKTTLAGTPEGEKLYELAESQLRGVILDASELMLELEPFVSTQNRFARKAAGVVYEVMLAARARTKILSNGEVAEKLARGSLGREDRPKEEQLGKSAAIDLVITGLHKTAVIQAKNGKSKQEYEPPIEVVYADTKQLIPNIPKISADFQVAVGKSHDQDVAVNRQASEQELAELFDSQLTALQDV